MSADTFRSPTSVLPAVRGYLLDKWSEAAAQVQIPMGSGSRTLEVIDVYPLEQTENDDITLGNSDVDWAQAVMMGKYVAGSRREQADIDVIVRAFGFGGTSPSEVQGNALQWLLLAQQVVDEDPTLGGLAYASSFTKARVETDEDDNGPMCTITCQFTYHAQI